VRVLDFDDPENNEFLAVNQLTVVELTVVEQAEVLGREWAA
jgi:type I site-specific restriction-modification system R (restriction) subunit